MHTTITFYVATPHPKVFHLPSFKFFLNHGLHCDNIDRPKSCDILNYCPTLAGTKVEKQHLKLRQQKCVPCNVLLLVILRFSIPGLRNETEAASNTASTSLEHTNIINHTFRLYKCTSKNIKVGMTVKLRRVSNAYQMNEGSNRLMMSAIKTNQFQQFVFRVIILLKMEFYSEKTSVKSCALKC